MENSGESGKKKSDEPALITIVEGPPPQFYSTENARWTFSVSQDATTIYAPFQTETRTLKGQMLVTRCREAWDEGRQAYLDFPHTDGLRERLQIVAVRLVKFPEGQKLDIWVRRGAPDIDVDDIDADEIEGYTDDTL